MNPTTNHLLVTNAASGDATVIDAATNVVIATLPVGGAGEATAIPSQGRFVVAGQSVPFALTVLQDPAAAALASITGAPAGGAGTALSATLRPLGPLPISGSVSLTAGAGGATTIAATLQGVSAGSPATLAVPLASGSATLSCTAVSAGASATCSQTISGQPNVGGNVVVSIGGQAVAQGALVPG